MVVRQVGVELVGLLFLYIALGPFPQGLHGVQRLRVCFRRLALVAEADRVGDEVGVFFDQLAYAPLVQILVHAFAHFENDGRAGLVARRILKRVGAVPDRDPLDRLLTLAALEGDDRDLLGDHEGRVKAHAELPDQLGDINRLAFFKRLREGFGARTGDHAQVFVEFLLAHADAVVRDHQSLVLRVGDDVDPPRRSVGDNRFVGQAQILGAVDRVRGVRDQLAQEDLFF